MLLLLDVPGWKMWQKEGHVCFEVIQYVWVLQSKRGWGETRQWKARTQTWNQCKHLYSRLNTKCYSYTNVEHMFKPITSFPPAWCGCKASSASVLYKNQSTFWLVWEPKWCLELSSRSWSHFYGKKIIVNLWDPYVYHSWNSFSSSSHSHYLSGHSRTPYKQLNTKIAVCIK